MGSTKCWDKKLGCYTSPYMSTWLTPWGADKPILKSPWAEDWALKRNESGKLLEDSSCADLCVIHASQWTVVTSPVLNNTAGKDGLHKVMMSSWYSSSMLTSWKWPWSITSNKAPRRIQKSKKKKKKDKGIMSFFSDVIYLNLKTEATMRDPTLPKIRIQLL